MSAPAVEEAQTRFLKCVGDPVRFRILKMLVKGERCVCDIVEALGREQTLVSHHLRALKACNIVKSRKEGRRTYYSITDEAVVAFVSNTERLVRKLSLVTES